MTIPVTLATISNLQDTTTAQTNINNNSAAITGGFSTALNVTGDQMKGNLDMNSNQIFNLPVPATANSPARLADIISASTAITIPPTGTSGAVVPLLNTANTWSNTQSFGAIFATTITATSLTATTISVTTLNVTGSSVFANSASFGSMTIGGAITFGSAASGVRQAATGNLSFYVNTSTGNDSNQGTSSAPFKTIGGGITYIQKNVDIGGNSLTLNVAGGTYAEQVTVQEPWVGSNIIKIVGAGSATTTIQAPNGSYGLFVKDAGMLQIQGVNFSATSGAAGGIYVGHVGVLDLQSDITYSSMPSIAHMTAINGGVINLDNNYTINGGAGIHTYATAGGKILINSITVSVPSAVTFTTGCAYVNDGGLIDLQGTLTFSGSGVSSCTGVKFVVLSDGGLVTQGVDANTIFPGNASGSYMMTGGWDSAVTQNTLTTLGNISVAKGYVAVVSDATVTTPNTTITGGGSNTVLGWYNGSVWRILAS